MAELLRFYSQLPARQSEEAVADWTARLGDKLTAFEAEVGSCYLEGTLQRVLNSSLAETRQAAVLALGRLGTMDANAALAGMLRDPDDGVRELAEDALWLLWFRAAGPEAYEELRRLSARVGQPEADVDELLAGFAALLEKAPDFAEAYNQRAVLHYRRGRWHDAVADCARVLRLNPHHFGAAAGMAQCYLKQKKVRLALRAYRRAYQLNPNLAEIQQAIRSLERLLGEEGKR
jgi:tetratricopeptide (TPR) repeat protein